MVYVYWSVVVALALVGGVALLLSARSSIAAWRTPDSIVAPDFRAGLFLLAKVVVGVVLVSVGLRVLVVVAAV